MSIYIHFIHSKILPLSIVLSVWRCVPEVHRLKLSAASSVTLTGRAGMHRTSTTFLLPFNLSCCYDTIHKVIRPDRQIQTAASFTSFTTVTI